MFSEQDHQQMILEMRANFLEESGLLLEDCERAILNLANKEIKLDSLEEIIDVSRFFVSICNAIEFNGLASFASEVESFLSELADQDPYIGSDTISLLLGVFEGVKVGICAYGEGRKVNPKIFAQELTKMRNFFPYLESEHQNANQQPTKDYKTHEYFNKETEAFILARSEEVYFAVPCKKVLDTTKIDSNQLSQSANGWAVVYQGETLQLANYKEFAQFGADLSLQTQMDNEFSAVLIGANDEKLYLRVDSILGRLEGVIKPFGELIGPMPGLKGFCHCQDSQIAYVLDPELLIEHVNKLPKKKLLKGA